MQAAADDADHLAKYSDATYPVGPDKSGEITYVHVPPLNPLSILIVALGCTAVAAFVWCYIHPLVRKCRRTRTAERRVIKRRRAVLASARSLFGLRPKAPPPTTPQLLARYGGTLDMRIARPPAAVSLSRGSLLSPSLTPSLSSSSSGSPTPGTPPMYSPPSSSVPEVVVAPVDVSILGGSVGSRTTPKKKGGERYDGHGAEEDE